MAYVKYLYTQLMLATFDNSVLLISSTILPLTASGGWVRTFNVENSYIFKLQYSPKGYFFVAAETAIS